MIVAVERRDQLPKAITLVLQVRSCGLCAAATASCHAAATTATATAMPRPQPKAMRNSPLQAAMPTRACAVPPALLLQAIEREGAMDKLRTKQFAADKLFLQQVRLQGSAAVPAFVSAALCMDVAPAFLAAAHLWAVLPAQLQ